MMGKDDEQVPLANKRATILGVTITFQVRSIFPHDDYV